MKEREQIKNIQVFNQNNEIILECSKGYSFPVKYVDKKPVDNVLVLKGKGFPELNMNDMADVIINTKSGNRIKYFCKVSLSTTHQLNLILDTEKAKSLEEKRRYYRIKTAINCRISDIIRGEEVIPYNPNLYGKIHDINIGGIFVVVDSSEKYKVDDLISFTTVLGNNRLEASARILRLALSEDGGTTGYKCCFAAITSQQEEIISSYINYLQIEERRIEIETEKLAKGARQ